MLPIVGIDLGTTFSAIAYVDSLGQPQVIRDAAGQEETPSIVCFGGREAWVGDKADARKARTPHDIFEFVKRDIGKPIESGGGDFLESAPYEIGGYRYGPAGLSAILLRYLKKLALRHFRKLSLTAEAEDSQIGLRAVITVPAYFGEKERRETRLAGLAAGFEVVGILNEPTAAALAFGLSRREDQTILVFDLGGGTFDVTILRMEAGDAVVLATRGDNTLGGRDFDEIIQTFLLDEAKRQTGFEVEESAGFEIQKLAIAAKHALSSAESTTVSFSHGGRDLDIVLHRKAPTGDLDLLGDDFSHTFYFEERAANLLQRCRALCESVIEGVVIDAVLGRRPAAWSDLGEIVLAGGSCKMPMVGDLLERLSGRKIRRNIEGFGHDTAIAVGAALYGAHRGKVHDVLSHGLGIKLERGGRKYIDFVLKKDSPIPREVVATYQAQVMAELEIWEGESEEPDECVLRGRLELENHQEASVKMSLAVDADGCLKVVAELPRSARKEMEIRNDHFEFRERASELHRRIQSLVINI